MTEVLINTLQELDGRISSNFPLKVEMLGYFHKLQAENISKTTPEYIKMAFDITAMYFHDAIELLPLVLHIEISRMIAGGFGGCAECAVYWICGLSSQEMQSLTLAQLVSLRDWIELVAANGFADEVSVKKAVDIIGVRINSQMQQP